MRGIFLSLMLAMTLQEAFAYGNEDSDGEDSDGEDSIGEYSDGEYSDGLDLDGPRFAVLVQDPKTRYPVRFKKSEDLDGPRVAVLHQNPETRDPFRFKRSEDSDGPRVAVLRQNLEIIEKCSNMSRVEASLVQEMTAATQTITAGSILHTLKAIRAIRGIEAHCQIDNHAINHDTW